MKILVQTPIGKKVVQIVHRKNGTTFIRKAAVDTWSNPSPSQRRVREIFTRAATGQFNRADDGQTVASAVREAFEGYEKTPRPLNRTELEIVAANPETLKQILKVKEKR